MARINRSDVIQKAVNDLALSASDEKIPNETLDKVQLVYSLNKQFSSFILQGNQATTGTISTSMPNISAGGEIYLTGCTMSIAKDATCDTASGKLSLQVTPDFSNVANNLLSISVLTLTAQSESIAISFPYPLKIKAGTSITLAGAFTVGAMTRSFSAYGFISTSN